MKPKKTRIRAASPDAVIRAVRASRGDVRQAYAAASTEPPPRAKRSPTPQSVFLNLPFEASYEDAFLALVVGIVAAGARPRTVLELVGPNRLDRLRRMIGECRASFHDLSYVALSAPRDLPRFNMPFEAGLAFAAHPAHAFVLERQPFRLQMSLSDLNGVDPLIYDPAKPVALAVTVAAYLGREDDRRRQIAKLFGHVRARAADIRAKHEAGSLYDIRVFRALVAMTAAIAGNIDGLL